jgi:large subunit ribosomal protein L4e
VESTKKTSVAKDLLAAVGALDDVEKAGDSKKIRAGKGKMRGRRYVMRRGPLVIYKANDGVEQAFRNLPGVELCCVDRLNLLQLAPGGHMGRFCVWSQAAFEALDEIYGENGKRIPDAIMANADLARIINSDEIQSIVKPAKTAAKIYDPKANPLKSIVALEKLDPYAANKRRMAQTAEKDRAANRDALLAKKRAARTAKKAFKAQGKKFIAEASKQGDVCANGFTIE